ncbi:MAG: amidohydrolase family protein [Planctomycetia bacterium]
MLRRTFLAATGAGLGMTTAWPLNAAGPPVEVIDSHAHFYRTPWPDTMPEKQREKLFPRPRLPDDLVGPAREAGVTGTVVVEASPDLEDNQWLLDLAAKEPFILGVVGRIDPAADGFDKHLERFAANSVFRGIRIVQGEILAGLAGKTPLVERCRALADRGLTLDVVGDPGVIEPAAQLAAEVPRLPIVINHAGNLRIDGQPPRQSWRDAMQAAANQPNVRCKVSAIVENTATSPAPRDVAYYTPVLDALWTLFGPERLLFGSNWPIWTRKTSFADVVGVVRDYWAAKGEEAAGKFFHRNARATYGLKPR